MKKALRDYTGAKDKQALSEFADFTNIFRRTPTRPRRNITWALFTITANSMMTPHRVFEAVAERFPDSPKAPDAM